MAQITISPDSLPERAYQTGQAVARARTIEDENNNALFGATAGLVKAKRGSKTTSTQITVSTTPTLLLAANPARLSATLTVKSGTGSTVYLGPTNAVSASIAGIWLAAGQQISDTDTTDAWWAVADTGSFVVGVLEVS